MSAGVIETRSFLIVSPENSPSPCWFQQHVQPHEGMLRAWLRSRFPAEGDVDDIVQEAYARLLEARKTTAIESPKSFVFAIARNLALGRLRRAQAVGGGLSLADFDCDAVLDESVDVPQTVARNQELELLTQAIQALPTRCRQIITLRKIYGLSQKDVAAQLGIAEHTVEAQGTIGLRKMAEFFERIERRGR